MPTKTPTAVPASRSADQPGVLERLPGDLEQQPLLRVDDRSPRAGEMPKKAASNRSTPLEEAAAPREVVPAQLADRPSARPGPRRSRRAPSRSSSQNASGPPAPGNRQPMPMIAIGSRPPRGAAIRRRDVAVRRTRRRGMPRQRVDRGMLVDQGRRERPAEPLLELAPRAATARSEPRPKPAKGARGVDLLGPDAQRLGEPGGQPGRDRVPRDGRRRDRAVRSPRPLAGHAAASRRRAVVPAGPFRDRLERPGQEGVAAGVAPDLAARGPGQARRLDQPDRARPRRRAPRRPPRRIAATTSSAAPSRSLRSTSTTTASRSSPSTSTAKAAPPPVRSAGWLRPAAHSMSWG